MSVPLILSVHRHRFCPAAVVGAALGVGLLLLEPTLAEAALAKAAGKDGALKGSGGGFGELVSFLDQLATYLIFVGAAYGALGLIRAGVEYQSGSPQAGRTLGGAVIGLTLVLLCKSITL